MKTILVTGGAGFIGSNFVRHLLNKYLEYKIIVLDALTYAGNIENLPAYEMPGGRLEFWYGDVRNPEIVNALMAKSDIIVHFAAESHVARSIFDNAVFFETDVMGTQVISNAVLKNKNVQRFIHISTSEVYGTAEFKPMSEEHPLNPKSPYASAKAGADRLVYSYWATYGIPAIIVRPFNNYGANQHLEKVVPRFITGAIRNENLTIHGDGSAERDWIYVNDTCEAIDAIMHAPDEKVIGEVFNIGTGRCINVKNIAEIVLEKMKLNKNAATHIGDRPGQVDCHIANITKISETVGWKPKISFEEGINKTIAWYQDNQPWWEKLLWMKSVPIKTADGKTEYH